MVPFLYTPREHHNVGSAQEYLSVQAAFLARRRQGGARFQVHESTQPLTARVDANTWLVDCECGAGNATDPDWGIACCFGCGAIHRQIRFPSAPDRIVAERALLARPLVQTRHWHPARQTPADLETENAARGILAAGEGP